jgi:hypothetical protein
MLGNRESKEYKWRWEDVSGKRFVSFGDECRWLGIVSRDWYYCSIVKEMVIVNFVFQ